MPSVPLYIGIDPGSNGGLAVLEQPFGREPLLAAFNEFGVAETWALLHSLIRFANLNGAVVGIERVGGFMGKVAGEEGGNRNRASGHTMFAFGKSVGILYGLLTAAGFRDPIEVTPSVWQRSCGLVKRKGEKGGPWKTRLLEEARRRYPDVKVTKATSDALLIADHLKRTHTGEDEPCRSLFG